MATPVPIALVCTVITIIIVIGIYPLKHQIIDVIHGLTVNPMLPTIEQ